MEQVKVSKPVSSKISCKRPNNAYILNNSEFVEVVQRQPDVEQGSMYLCREYNRLQPLFNQPCDSRLVGNYRGSRRNTTMRIVPGHTLQKRAILIEEEEPLSVILMKILHQL